MYHHNGNLGNEGSNQLNYRKYSGHDRNSDEFLNDYIPKGGLRGNGVQSAVMWKDVLALGMIPETRNNPHIRPEIQYKNAYQHETSAASTEAPSPAPAPLHPEQERLMVLCERLTERDAIIHAEPITSEFISECNYISNTINLKITNTMTNINYIHKINSEDEFWKQNSQYFPNFEKFYDILNSSLNNGNEYVQSKIELDGDNLKVILIHEGLYSFEIEIIIPKEKDRLDSMEEKIEQLMKENIYLKNQNKKIMKIIQENTVWDVEYLWLALDNMCINNNINDTTTPFSGELVDEKQMKNRMLCNNYWACYVAENGKCYYSGITLHWRHCVSLLNSTSHKNKLYIRIPKQDIGNGIGEMNSYPDYQIKNRIGYKKGINNFHGRPDPLQGPSTSTNKFIIRYGSFKYQDWQRAGREANGEADKWKNFPCNNIHIPVEYYCTNCNCIESKIFSKEGEPKEGWEVYECQGH